MGRNCHTCEVLRELYWLKLSQFILSMRSSRTRQAQVREEDLIVLKDETLSALRTLLRHAKCCYGLVQDEAA
jgi:hypothetical protein